MIYYKNAIKADGVMYYIAYNFFLPVILIGPINSYIIGDSQLYWSAGVQAMSLV
jgi:hypothetical protein